MKKVEAFVTDDDQVFFSESEAKLHEEEAILRTKLFEVFRNEMNVTQTMNVVFINRQEIFDILKESDLVRKSETPPKKRKVLHICSTPTMHSCLNCRHNRPHEPIKYVGKDKNCTDLHYCKQLNGETCCEELKGY